MFTGDALFIGDVGRTDFYPHRANEVAGLLFDSLQKICALGDQTLLYPAHGASSICGNKMVKREFSSIGYEKQNNPGLRIKSREEFIAKKVAEHHYQPPYFRRMERLNLEGGSPIPSVAKPAPLLPNDFYKLIDTNVIVDVRGATAFLGAHLPGSLAIPLNMIPMFAGWLLEADNELALVVDDTAQAERAMCYLGRIGYDHVTGYLSVAMTAWAAQGLAFKSLNVVDAYAVAERVKSPPQNWTLLDVRSKAEIDTGIILGSAVETYCERLMH